ncbi:MAG: hypothetical protein WCQ70_10735 [Lentimicrobiaceae bacterium]
MDIHSIFSYPDHTTHEELGLEELIQAEVLSFLYQVIVTPMTSFLMELPIWSQMTEILYTHRDLIIDRTLKGNCMPVR